MTFAETLKDVREKRIFSMSRLAALSDFTPGYVSRLESGERRPTRDAVDRLADALGVTASEKDALLESAGFLGQRPVSAQTIAAVRASLVEVMRLLDDGNPNVMEGE